MNLCGQKTVLHIVSLSFVLVSCCLSRRPSGVAGDTWNEGEERYYFSGFGDTVKTKSEEMILSLRTTRGAFLCRFLDTKQILKPIVPRNPIKHICTALIQLPIAFRDTKGWLGSLVKMGRLERR